MKRKDINFLEKFDQIFSGDEAQIDQLARGFHCLLDIQLLDSKREMDLLKAMGDRENLVKEQIKYSTIEHVIARFDECYFQAAGKAWD